MAQEKGVESRGVYTSHVTFIMSFPEKCSTQHRSRNKLFDLFHDVFFKKNNKKKPRLVPGLCLVVLIKKIRKIYSVNIHADKPVYILYASAALNNRFYILYRDNDLAVK